MKIIGIVHGDAEQAVPLLIGTNRIYVHTDIKPNMEIDPMTGKLYADFTYHEVQYEKDEYIKLMAEQTTQNNQLMNTILGVNE